MTQAVKQCARVGPRATCTELCVPAKFLGKLVLGEKFIFEVKTHREKWRGIMQMKSSEVDCANAT